MWITQTAALLRDAYRELNAKKLFWITMILNVLVVAIFGALGINENGTSFLHWQFDSEFFNTTLISPEVFYKLQYVTWAVPWWLTWIATILALVSTAGIIPELISGGTIETLLSKPIGRVRLFLTKYVCGLLFVALQVFVFSLCCFLVIGIRGGAWEFGLFMAVPIVLLFFSYLFGVCVLLGMITRSTVASLLLTILFWFAVFIVNAGEGTILSQREGVALRVEDGEEDIVEQQRIADRLIQIREENGEPILDSEGEPITETDAKRQAVNPSLGMTRDRLEEARASSENWSTWADRVTAVKTLLPKTQETIGLLERYLITQEEVERLMTGREVERDPDAPDIAMADPRVPERLQEFYRSRSTTWIIGTSIIFEIVVVGMALILFVRRDF